MEGSGEEFGEEFGEEKPKSSEKMIKCNICGEEIPLKRYPSHLKESHPEEYEGWKLKIVEGRRKSQEVRELLKRAEMAESIEKTEEMPPEQLVALEGREGLNKIKFKRLMTFLDNAPNVTSSQKRWIELRWNTYAKMRDDPSELFKALRDVGIRESICTAIVQAVFSVEEEYADILTRRGEPVYISRPTPHEPTISSWGKEPYYPSGQPRISYPTPTPPYQYQPYHYQPPPQYMPSWAPQTVQSALTKDDILRIINEYFKEKFEKREFEEKLESLRNDFESIKDYIIEIRHEIDKKISEAESEKKRSVSPDVEVLKARLEESNRTIEKLSEHVVALQQLIERKEKDRLEAEIKNLRTEQRILYEQLDKLAKSATASGYTNDTYRLMSQLASELGDRRPLRDIIKILFPERYIPHTTPSSKLPPDIESELRSEGLIEYAG
ncbi:MAG: hypothetical protein QXI11_00915 [Thermoproteota archaeon]